MSNPFKMPPLPPVSQVKPGVIPLRPLFLGEILRGALATMRRYPALIFGVSAVVALVVAGVNFVFGLLTMDERRRLSELVSQNLSPEEELNQLGSIAKSLFLAGGANLLVTALATSFLAGFLTIVVGRAVLGRSVSFTEVVSELKSRLLPLLGLTAVYGVLVAIATLCFVVPGVWVYVLLSLATPALILERGQLVQSLRRSRLLVAGSWWRVFGILVITFLISAFVGGLISLGFDSAGGSVEELFSGNYIVPTSAQLLSQSVGSVFSGVLTLPFTAAVTALVYIDQRIRKENMAEQLLRSAKQN